MSQSCLFLFYSFCSLSLLLLLSPVLVLVSAQSSTANLLEVNVDRVSATTARIRFLNAPPSSITYTLIQYTPNAAVMNGMNRGSYHACATFASSGCQQPPTFTPSDDLEVNITQGTLPISSYILRGLKPLTTYQVRVAYIDTSNPPQVIGTAAARAFTTTAVSGSTFLSSLVASGGCGSLTSTATDGTFSSLYNLTTSLIGSERVYRCDVVFDINNITLSVTPPTPYSLISPNTSFTSTIQPLSLNALLPADPFLTYTTNIPLGAEGSITNFSFIVTSEANTTLIHTLSIFRVPVSTTSTLRGPTSPVTAMIRTPSIPSSYDYRALLWEGTTVGPSSWKVWSDDFTIFPFSSFNITFPYTLSGGGIDYSLLRVLVTPAAAHSTSASCSNINVGLFLSNQHSSHAITCVTALNDYCSTTPAGVATKWTSYYDSNNQPQLQLLYNPPPPTPTFPKA